MPYQVIDNLPVFGEPLENAVKQMHRCMQDDRVVGAALMADHHVGYGVPVGGVIAYEGHISPTGVGVDIACGNKAVRTDADPKWVRENIESIMDDVAKHLSFGVGRKNAERVEAHCLDSHRAWELDWVAPLRDMARNQLGTIGGGNHYVDIFVGRDEKVWVGCHFGSRGLGHKIAQHIHKVHDWRDGMHIDPLVLAEDSDWGQQYLIAMDLAGQYAYAGRDWVCQKVASLMGASIDRQVHNHHNFAWQEIHNDKLVWVIRKGATPAFTDQESFVGGSMGDFSFILRGVSLSEDEQRAAMYSTVHGAGRVMSRTEAAGKSKWINGRPVRVGEGKVSRKMMDEYLAERHIVLRGGGCDESPHCYKNIVDVLGAHSRTVEIDVPLLPMGVAMAPEAEYDPYKD